MKKCTTVKMNRKVFGFGTADDGPGPAAYGVKTTVGRINRMPTIANEPAYTLKRRLDMSNASESPGPVYDLTRLTCRGKAGAPKYSMGAKLAGSPDWDNPGPAAYMPRVPEKRAKPKMLFPLKELDPRADNPGPNAYMLPSTLRRRGVTLAKKIDLASNVDSPGPAVYHAVPVDKYKKRAPNFTLAKQFKDPSLADRNDDTTPSPQAYNPTSDNKYDRTPRFSFGMRRPDKFPPLVVCGDEVKKQR